MSGTQVIMVDTLALIALLDDPRHARGTTLPARIRVKTNASSGIAMVSVWHAGNIVLHIPLAELRAAVKRLRWG